MLSKTAFVILSCDAYSELWETHFRCLDEHWPDCPFPKYILTNYKNSERPEITAIRIGDDLAWSANLKKAIETLRHEYRYILLTFDDLFLTETVDNRVLEEVLNSFTDCRGQFLQLIRWHNKPKKMNPYFGLIEPGSLYRPNCVYAIWDIDVLGDLLLPSENAWEFERNGAARSDRYERFFAVLSSVFHYRNSVIRGKIVRKDAGIFNLKNTQRLRVMSWRDTVGFYLRYWGFRLFLFLVPRKQQVRAAKMKLLFSGKKA